MPYQVKPAVVSLVLLITAAMGGCAGRQGLPLPPPAFPPPPAEPRYVYDATLRSSKDVETVTFRDKLQRIATGVTVQPMGLGKPYGVAARNGRVYITDTQQRAILMFDLTAKHFEMFGTEGEGSVLKPLGIDISSRGEIFVVDGTARRVMVYDLNGRFLRAIGSPKDLLRPSGIAVSPDGTQVYVVDTGGIDSDQHRVMVYDALSGRVLSTIGRRGAGHGEFNLPLQAATAPDGKLYVVDGGNFRVEAFNADGSYDSSFGSIGRRGGQFSRPKGVSIGPDGNIYVVDTAFGNLQIFSADGRLLLHLGERGTAGGPARYMLPAGVDVDEAGRVYIVDQFYRKVDIFRPVAVKPLDGIPTK